MDWTVISHLPIVCQKIIFPIEVGQFKQAFAKCSRIALNGLPVESVSHLHEFWMNLPNPAPDFLHQPFFLKRMHGFVENATASPGLPGNLVVGAQKTVVGQEWTVQKVQHHPQMAPVVDSGDLLQCTNVTEQRAVRQYRTWASLGWKRMNWRHFHRNSSFRSNSGYGWGKNYLSTISMSNLSIYKMKAQTVCPTHAPQTK